MALFDCKFVKFMHLTTVAFTFKQPNATITKAWLFLIFLLSKHWRMLQPISWGCERRAFGGVCYDLTQKEELWNRKMLIFFVIWCFGLDKIIFPVSSHLDYVKMSFGFFWYHVSFPRQIWYHLNQSGAENTLKQKSLWNCQIKAKLLEGSTTWGKVVYGFSVDPKGSFPRFSRTGRIFLI